MVNGSRFSNHISSRLFSLGMLIAASIPFNSLVLICVFFSLWLFNSLKISFWDLLEKEIIRVENGTLGIEYSLLSYKFTREKFYQDSIFNFQVCCSVLHGSKPAKRVIRNPYREFWALSFYDWKEGIVIFANGFDEQSVREIMHLIQVALPSVRTHWEMSTEKLAWLIQILIEFALLARFRKQSLDDLLLSSGIPKNLLQDIFNNNLWLVMHLNAFASGEKSSSLEAVPVQYHDYLNRVWRSVIANEDTVWDIIRGIFSELAKFISR